MIRVLSLLFVVTVWVVFHTSSAAFTGAVGGECFADCDCYEDANTTACFIIEDDVGICWCKPGYVYDNETRTCVSDCCALPYTPYGRYVLDTGETQLDSTATLVCCDGYTTSSGNSITCTESGWSEPQDQCVPRDCEGTPGVTFGAYVADGSLVGSIAVLACDENYVADSLDTCIVCGTDGVWTNPGAGCIRDCGVPTTTNGHYILDAADTSLGATATLDCCDGFSTMATVQITCEADGWSEGAMECSQDEPECPSGDWILFGSSCYYFGTQDLTYNSARDRCIAMNSHLVQIDSQAELIFVKNIMNNLPPPTYGYWNDLYEWNGVNGQERWRTSEDPLIVSDWRPPQPDDFNGVKQVCTAFWKDFAYQQGDIECGTTATPTSDGRRCRALCEIDL